MAAHPLRRVTLRNLASHKLRLALSVLAVVLGTAFVTGSFVFTATLQQTFDRIVSQGAQDISAQITSDSPDGTGVPLDVVDRARTLPGVARAEPRLTGTVVLLKADGTPYQTGGAPTEGVAWSEGPDSVEPTGTIDSGRAPAADGEVALPRAAAEAAGLTVGGPARVYTTARGTVDGTLVGVYTPRTDGGGYVGVAFSPDQARALFTDGTHSPSVSIAAAPGVGQDEVRDQLAAAFPELTVKTGDQVRDERSEQFSSALRFVNYFFVAFGVVSLIVGTFIIYNTFSMLVAQRLRELALLRAIGASRRQIIRSVLGEALLTGVIGSVLGVLAGIGLAAGIFAILEAFDLGLPSGGLALTPTAVVLPLVLGLAVTLVSAAIPARRAGRIPPVAAMRAGSTSAPAHGPVRTVVGVYLLVVGVALGFIGTWQDETKPGAITVGIGALGVVLGAFLVMPALARPIAGGIGRVIGRPFGAIGRLAATNAGRNTTRTAATAFALTLGVMLVAAFGTVGATTKASIDSAVGQGVHADLVVQGVADNGPPTPLPGDLHTRVAAVPGVRDVTWQSYGYGELGGERAGFPSFGGPVAETLDPGLTEGTLDPGADGLVVSRDAARQKGWTLGTTVPLVGIDGRQQMLRVVGVYEKATLAGPYYIGMGTYEQLIPEQLRKTGIMAVRDAPGTDPDRVREAVESALADLPVATVQTTEQYVEKQAGSIDQVLTIVYALLALSLVIAVLGIVNTLALSVIERRTEIGMLRAVGMQRAQVRRIVYLESTQIAMFGAVVGAVAGVFLGWAFVTVLASQGLQETTIPWGTVAAMLAGSAVVGVMASILPAQRAARTDPLEAIAD